MTRQPLHRAAALLASAGPTVSVPETAAVLEISKGTAYSLIARGEFPVRTLRLGRSIRVPTADLARLVGVDLTRYADNTATA